MVVLIIVIDVPLKTKLNSLELISLHVKTLTSVRQEKNRNEGKTWKGCRAHQWNDRMLRQSRRGLVPGDRNRKRL